MKAMSVASEEFLAVMFNHYSPDVQAMCDDCFIAIEEGKHAPHRKVRCQNKSCGREIRTCASFDKNEGKLCIYCAHKLELEAYKGHHETESCPICRDVSPVIAPQQTTQEQKGERQ